MREGKSFYHYKDCFQKGNNDLSTAGILFGKKNLESASFHTKEAIERYLVGYIYYKGWKNGQICGINGFVNEAMTCNSAFEKLQCLCRAMSEIYSEDQYPAFKVSKLDQKIY